MLQWLALLACVPDAHVASPPCGALVDGPLDVLEGDVVAIAVSCQEPGPYAFTASGLPEGATIDGGVIAWTPGLDDAGSYAMAVYARPGGGGSAEVVPITLHVADAWDAPDNVLPDPATYARELGLPVVHLFPTAPLSREDVPATVWIDGVETPGRLKIRGASSSGYPKPGYAVSLDSDADLDAWDLGTPDEFVLLTTFDDNSYVRQKLAFDLWSDLAAFHDVDRIAPRTAFVVVYLDGAYHGLFVAADRVDMGFLREVGLEEGGNLYKSVNHDANFRATNVSGDPKVTLHDGYEKKEGPPTDFSDLDALVAFSAGSSRPAFVAGMSEFIDPVEFIDWYLYARFADAGDSGGKNAYLYREPSSTRFRYAPWDMNHSFGQDWRTIRVPSDNANDFRWTNQIFVHLQDDPASHDAMVARWSASTSGPFSAESLRAEIDGYYAVIEPSARRDWGMWAAAYAAYGGWSDSRQGDLTDFDGERAYLEQWLDARAAWAIDVAP